MQAVEAVEARGAVAAGGEATMETKELHAYYLLLPRLLLREEAEEAGSLSCSPLLDLGAASADAGAPSESASSVPR